MEEQIRGMLEGLKNKMNPFFRTINKKNESQIFWRNYMCPFYGKCLDAAAQRDLVFECTRCGYRNAQMNQIRFDEIS